MSALLALSVCGCSKFLDVNPKGETFDNDMFTSAEGYEDALYGIYSELSAKEDLYGGNLVWMAEVMSQNTTALSDNTFGNLATANWKINGPTSLRKKVWSNAYTVINHLNNIIQHAEKGGENEFKHSKLYLGEALALRAMIHFDLVRYFGAPFWASEDLKAKAIPYVSRYAFSVTDYSSLDAVYDLITAELTRAESLLEEDSSLIPAERTNSAYGFTDARITHLNLYAVQALLARVYWTRGDSRQRCHLRSEGNRQQEVLFQAVKHIRPERRRDIGPERNHLRILFRKFPIDEQQALRHHWHFRHILTRFRLEESL